ncbi:DUF4037 domain-containing protein [Paenibacillus albicereus]|uniref:DUF4037 domain-containing protein n=1 Tax=Paenibacillus albicereus TaxID=2726185 RepID=A0A6H2GXA6_9BACL|nr:DUF4037 domain-containing protein [Paenibacillus albicereus]QJC52063.1 DUF4037 domain-containing protein [Paenibacillus albicereus]
MAESPFRKGIELCRRYHRDIIEPFMASRYPHLAYSSALLGPGSEVLGYDTEMSADHDWGPRVGLFVSESDRERIQPLRQALDRLAPQTFEGYAVEAGKTVATTVTAFLDDLLAVDSARLDPLDWLTIPSQSLLEITKGAVYRDDSGQLAAMRRRFRYYPHDIWLYMLAAGWQRIGQEEHLMLRSGYAGDELGSAVIASRLVRDVMNLCFLMEREYAPYPKWFGTAFGRLKSAAPLLPLLWSAQTATAWKEREQAFNDAYRILSGMHNQLGLTAPVPEAASAFYDRPFRVMDGSSVASLLIERIEDAGIQALARTRLIGSIDQISDNTDFRMMATRTQKDGRRDRSGLQHLYRGESSSEADEVN